MVVVGKFEQGKGRVLPWTLLCTVKDRSRRASEERRVILYREFRDVSNREKKH